MHTKGHGFLRMASSSAVEFLLDTILCMKFCEQHGTCDWQLVVMPLTFHLGHAGGKNSSVVTGRRFSVFHPKAFILFACPFFFLCLFLRTEFLRMEFRGSVSPFVQNIDPDIEQISIAGSCGVFSELCLAQGYQLLWWEPARSGEEPALLFPAMAADVEHI